MKKRGKMKPHDAINESYRTSEGSKNVAIRKAASARNNQGALKHRGESGQGQKGKGKRVY